MARIIIFIPILILFAGCGENRIDSSSDESFKESIEAVKDSLSEVKKQEFEKSMQVVAMAGIGNIFEIAADPDGLQRRCKDRVNGKTVDEVIAESRRILAERQRNEQEESKTYDKLAQEMAAKNREQAISQMAEIGEEIKELIKKQERAKQYAVGLKRFEVVRSRFYYQEDSFMKKPIIELTVKNRTNHAVSRAYFEGILSTPGRSVPWVQDTFNYEIPGGLEPEEEVTWNLAPNMFGEWGNAPEDRNDMVLAVTVTRIDGAEGDPIFDSEFSDYDKERLEELTKHLEELKKTLE